MRYNVRKKLVFIILVICMSTLPLSAFAYTTNGQNGTNGTMDDVTDYGTDDIPPCDWQCPGQLATGEDWLITRELPSRQMGLNILGDIPMVTSEFNGPYNLINRRIDDVIDDLISEARRMRARSITFSHEAVRTSCMVSILIRVSVSSAIYSTLVRSVNFCPHTGEFLTIRNAMDFDIVPLANRMLAERMRRSPENFYAAPSVSLDEQAFFVTCSSITILFDEFQLSSVVSGVFSLELRKANIRTVTISQDQVLPHDHAYNLMMVPLRYVTRGLGYHPYRRPGGANIWFASGSDVRLIAWLYQGINEYHTPDMTQSLEVAPYNRGGLIYVPITFFEQILPLTVYNIDSFGNITFLAYLI